MIAVTKTFLPAFDEYTAILKRAWDKGWVTNNGELVQEKAALEGEAIYTRRYFYPSLNTVPFLPPQSCPRVGRCKPPCAMPPPLSGAAARRREQDCQPNLGCRMIIAGAGGFAKQLVEVFYQLKQTEGLYFFDNTANTATSLFGHRILKNFDEAAEVLATDNRFCLGVGGPVLRRKLFEEFIRQGGKPQTVISPYAYVNRYATVKAGVTMLTGSIIENDAVVDEGVLINMQTFVPHDVHVGAFSEVAPGARIAGGCTIGEEVFIGMNAVVVSKLTIGTGAVIAAGAIVTKDVAPYSLMVGNPAMATGLISMKKAGRFARKVARPTACNRTVFKKSNNPICISFR